MLSAIGSSTYPSPVGTGSSADLQAQLDRYQQSLSDCVNCSSAVSSATASGSATTTVGGILNVFA